MSVRQTSRPDAVLLGHSCRFLLGRASTLQHQSRDELLYRWGQGCWGESTSSLPSPSPHTHISTMEFRYRLIHNQLYLASMSSLFSAVGGRWRHWESRSFSQHDGAAKTRKVVQLWDLQLGCTEECTFPYLLLWNKLFFFFSLSW